MRTLEKIISGILIGTTSLTLLGCGLKPIEKNTMVVSEAQYQAEENSNNPKLVIISNNLLVNKDNKVRYVSYKNEEKGLNDLLGLIYSSELEENWVYLPEKKTWIEIGINEKTTTYENGYERYSDLDMNYLNYLMNNNKEIKIYHMHPNPEKYKNYLSWVPSANDISTFDVVFSKFYNLNKNEEDFLKKDFNLKVRIVSMYGMCDISMTEKARKDNKYVFENLSTEKIKQKEIGNFINKQKTKENKNIEQKICAYLKDRNNEYFNFEYISP